MPIPEIEMALEFQQIRDDFPVKQRLVYLNNASIGALSKKVVGAVTGFLQDVQDNGRLHYPDWCRHADTTIKERVGVLIGADKSELAFVKNTTEGILIVANGLDWHPGDNVIIADIEYPSNVYCWMNLAGRGVSIKWVKARGGRILLEHIDALIDRQTRLVSLSAVQFSNGFRLDLERLGALCQSRGVLLNLDAIQWVGALPLDLRRCRVDFLSFGGHKWLLAPIGTGIFYCRKESMHHIHPHNVGYHSVDKSEDHMDYDLTFRPNAGRFEEALVNFPGIWGLEAAVELHLALGAANEERYIFCLNALAKRGLEAKGYEIVSPQGEGEASGILSFHHPTLQPDRIAERLQAAKINLAIRGGNLRISPSVYNDEAEIGRLLEALP
jgi:selenocysteine lyase/cysteine desulfurase